MLYDTKNEAVLKLEYLQSVHKHRGDVQAARRDLNGVSLKVVTRWIAEDAEFRSAFYRNTVVTNYEKATANFTKALNNGERWATERALDAFENLQTETEEVKKLKTEEQLQEEFEKVQKTLKQKQKERDSLKMKIEAVEVKPSSPTDPL